GQVVGDRAAGPRRRPMPATAWRLRLHARIPRRPGVHRRSRDPHLRRDNGGHERRHRQSVGPGKPDLRGSRTTRFLLAAASPARLSTLRAAGVEPEVTVSSIDESTYHERSVSAQVHCLAQAKAQDVADGVPGDALVLGCDSLLEIDGVGYGKPLTVERAV